MTLEIKETCGGRSCKQEASLKQSQRNSTPFKVQSLDDDDNDDDDDDDAPCVIVAQDNLGPRNGPAQASFA